VVVVVVGWCLDQRRAGGEDRAVWREEGARGFLKGAAERMAIQAPLYGVALLAFELQKKWYLAHHPEQPKV
jgi:hypothetical protein